MPSPSSPSSSPAATRTRLQVDERRAQLIELGRKLFNERPYDDISIDDIADAAGVSKGLLYHYFSSKRGFYVAIVRASSEHMRELTEPRPGLPLAEQLETSLDAYLDYVAEYGRGYMSLLQSGLGTDPEVIRIVESMRQVVVERVQRGLGIETLDPSLRAAIRSWVGFLEGAMLDWVEHRDVDRNVLKALMVRTLQAAIETCAEHGVVALNTPEATSALTAAAPAAKSRKKR